jgi:hypothetical protein
MKFYKAIEIAEKPLIVWAKWADNLEQLIEMGEDENPLILPEELVPDFEYGVCPLKIVSGELVERTVPEMEAFEAEFAAAELLVQQAKLITSINSGTFTYDSKVFPMDERSRIFYQAFDRARGTGDVKCMTSDGKLYTLTNANIDAFLDEYFFQLRALSQPLV